MELEIYNQIISVENTAVPRMSVIDHIYQLIKEIKINEHFYIEGPHELKEVGFY